MPRNGCDACATAFSGFSARHTCRDIASDNAPDYAIVTASSSGDEVQIGGAWKKTKEQIGDVTLEFLSITIDDPSLPNALNVAAFKNNDGNYDITWRRRQNNQNAAEECAA